MSELTSELLLALVIGAGLVLYALTAGADFGAGVWSLVSRSEHREAERDVIRKTIAPVWEANHVWMIFVVVLAFTAFPVAFARAFTSLHVPLTIVLFGLVVRGSAFVFHAYGLDVESNTYHRAFEIASLVTPVALGMFLAGLLHLDETVYFGTWASPFGWAVGAFVLSLFLLLSATYLTHESDGAVQDNFRRRALYTEALCGVLAYVTVLAAPDSTELIANPTPLWPLHVATALAALITVAALYLRRMLLARCTVIVQVATVVVGYLWVAIQETQQSGLILEVPPALARALVPVLIVAAVILVPSLGFLYWVFRASARR